MKRTIALALIVAASTVSAPAATNATMNGTLTGVWNPPPANGVTVTLTSPTERLVSNVNRNGTFGFVALEPGDYTVSVTRKGWRTITFDVTMRIASICQGQMRIDIARHISHINVYSGGCGYAVSMIDNAPTPTRNFQDP